MNLMGNYNTDRRSSGDRNFGRRDYGSRDGGRGFDRDADRPMHKATCDNCKKECEVPFRPTNGKPVYCSDCFRKMKDNGQDSGRPARSDFRAPSNDFNKSQFDALHIKLDKILRMLEPKTTAVTTPIETIIEPGTVTDIKVAKAPKVKRAVNKLITTKE
jgi:CxxC-x17-CxxC domain-containing protein